MSSLGQGPEESFPYECDVCKLDGVVIEALIYCPECEECLCDSCEAAHKKPKASRFHKVQPVAELKGSLKEKGKPAPEPAIKFLCLCYQKGEISYYCCDHQDMICLTCKNVTHRKCNMQTIGEIADDTIAEHNYQEISEKANKLLLKAKGLKDDRVKSLKELKEKESQCKDGIQKTMKNMFQLLKNLAECALEELENKHQIQEDMIEKVQGTIESTIQLLEADIRLFKAAKSSNDKRSKFVARTKLLKSMDDCGSVIEEISNKMIFSDIQFEPDRKLQNLEEDLKSLGQIKVCISKHCEIPKEAFLNAHFSETTKVNTKGEADKKPIQISGVSFLNNGEFLICDYNNSKLMLYDASFKLTESTRTPSAPWDIALVNDSEVVVTYPVAKKLQYFTTRTLQPSRCVELSSSAWCWGVAVANDFVFVSCHYEGTPEVLVLDTDGNALKTINEASSGVKLQKPYYIASNRVGNKLFISDYDSNTIICISTEDKFMYAYSDAEMKYPRGIVVDDGDNAIVCCEGTNNIHVIKSDGSKHSIVVSSKDGIDKPHGLDYRSTYGVLVVGGKDKEDILIFSKQ